METTRRAIQFSAPEQVEVVEEPLPEPASDEVRVRTLVSAISPGTERLVYSGEVPSHLSLDPSIDALSGGLSFPLRYGYAAVGDVEAVGTDIDPDWMGSRVFSFQPHVSHFLATPEQLISLPASLDVEDAVIIPNVESAINLLMDGRPMVGERLVVFGQGIVGVLVTALVSSMPVQGILTVEPNADRRDRSEEWGADRAFHPEEDWEALKAVLKIAGPHPANAQDPAGGADLVFELSGQPSAVNDAIAVTGFAGRLVLGSWYGTNTAPVDLGGWFHRSRIRIKSSQVSTIDPAHGGRWSKDRRMQVVLDQTEHLRPGRLVSHTFSPEEAPEVYEQLTHDGNLFQPIFRYE